MDAHGPSQLFAVMIEDLKQPLPGVQQTPNSEIARHLRTGATKKGP